jgi:6-phosphogluconolactonase
VVERLTRVVRIHSGPEAAARAVADRLLELADTATARRGRFVLAVSGGRTPEPLFRALAELTDGPRRWPSWQLFLCDERVVPPEDPRSNYGLVRRLWLEPAGFPAANVHPIETSVPADEGAGRYERTLREFFPASEPATFDAVVLGIGPDGHTASLFPGASCLGEGGRWAAAEWSPSMAPHVPRVTLTLEGLGHARRAIFLVTGSDKRPAMGQILSRSGGAELPAAKVDALESVEWHLDRDASPPGL